MSTATNMDPAYNNRALPGTVIFSFILLTVATVIVSLRVYTRAWVKSVAGWDDILIIPALAFAIGWTAGLMVQIYQGGYGRHMNDHTDPELKILEQVNVADNDMSAFSVFCSRASICVFLLRIVGRIRTWTLLLYLALFLNVCTLIGTVIAFSVNCVPISKTWNTDTPGWCMGYGTLDALTRAFAAFNCVVDFMCAGIPFLAIRNVQLEMRVKAGLYVLLSCGVITAACSIGRIVALDFHTVDKTWDLVPLTYWTAAEMFGATIFASLPALHQLRTHYSEHHSFGRPKGSSSYGSRMQRFFSSKGSSRAGGGPTATIGSSGAAEEGAIRRTTDVYIELTEGPSHEPSREGIGVDFDQKMF